ncbi:hypothetical protein FOPG_09818 [Fusarium oxysporum f. sp. conglutinans race 2 54008]|nr:hypothetical protein FOPG_09818 [Fusarium oxysporum f. sp. conglutinans race 2 54008]KAG7003230.1 hypothetical protein FocnCong_v001614 [Fusarium oxysporum f. sp. conglutinans]
MDMSPRKENYSRSIKDKTDWPDQKWRSKGWLAAVVRNSYDNLPTTNAPSLEAVKAIMRIAKLARREQIPLPLLWSNSEDSRFKVLWTGVRNIPSLRLTGNIAKLAYSEMKSLLDQNTAANDPSAGARDKPDNDKLHVIKDSDIEEYSLNPEK